LGTILSVVKVFQPIWKKFSEGHTDRNIDNAEVMKSGLIL